MSKPTIIIVPGSFHLPAAYARLTEALRFAGYPVTAVQNPSADSDPALPDFDEDVAAIRKAIVKAVDQSQEVVVVMHSYGGMPGSEAARGLSKDDLAKQGKAGGVIRLYYMCAFAVGAGVSLWDCLSHQYRPWMVDEGDQVRAIDSTNTFYNDVSAETADALSKALVLQAFGAWKSKATWAAWKNIPSTYLICEKDNAMPAANQEGMVSQEGGLWTVERIAASHSPFLSMPETVAASVRRAAGETVG